MKENKYNIIQPLLFSIILAIGMLIGYSMNNSNDNKLLSKSSSINSAKSLEEVFKFLDSKYLYNTKIDNFVDKAMMSVVSELDPYSHYIPPTKVESVEERLEGHFIGIGIGSFVMNDTLFVLNVIDDSPAQKAGMKPMDRILQIGNVDISEKKRNVGEIKELIKKYKNKDLDLILLDREQNKKPITLRIESINNNTIDKHFMLSDSNVYLSISQFSNHTYRDFMQASENYLANEKIEKLIIDLRNNPGGYLQEVNKILDQFFTQSKLTLVKTVYKDGRQDLTKTSGRNFYNLKDVVVLINENSASGSEVLAGVLQDHDRGLIIGKQSFGKGLVQEQYNLNNGSALRLTIANYYLPSGRSIQKELDLDTFFVDSRSSHYENQDTFYSINKRRPMISGGGIYPDIAIEDSHFDELEYLFWKNDSIIIDWSIKYILSNTNLYRLSENEFIAEYQIEGDFSIFNRIDDFENIDQKLFHVFLKSRLAYILFGKNTEGKILSEYDPFIKEAVKQLNK